MNNLGKKLRILRETKGLSQIRVATILNINNKTLSDYEREVSQPDLETLKKISNLYEVTTDYLLDNNSDLKEDEFQFALYGEVKELTDEQKEDILDMVRIMKKRNKKE